MKVLSFHRSSKSNIKVSTKQTTQIIQNFNLILAEWKLENERFQTNRKKTEKRAMEMSNYFHKLWNVELLENWKSTSYVFLMKTMAITNNLLYAPFFSFFSSQFFIHIFLLIFYLSPSLSLLLFSISFRKHILCYDLWTLFPGF